MQITTPLLNPSNQAVPQSKKSWKLLKMNGSKMKFMVCGTRYNLDKQTIPSLKVGDSDIIKNKNVKFLGVISIHI